MDIALIGIGKIALDQHVPAIEGSSDWSLKATVSRRGTVPGVKSCADFNSFLVEQPDVRVVSLCMPPEPRFDYAAKAIAAGRHVMLEKPPGASLAACQMLADMAKQRRVTLFATWHSREATMVDAAKDWLADKALRRMSIIWKEDVRRWHPGQDWIWEPGGLGVFDPGINALSIMTKIVTEQLHLQCAQLEIPENRQAPIAANLQFAHPEGATVEAIFDWRQTGPQTWRIEAETAEGVLVLEDGGSRMSVNGEPQLGFADDALTGEYPRLYARMADLVRTGTSDADFTPLTHVADAFLLGHRNTVAAFHDDPELIHA